MYSSNCELLSLRRNRCGKIYLLAATIPRAALVDMSNEVSLQFPLYEFRSTRNQYVPVQCNYIRAPHFRSSSDSGIDIVTRKKAHHISHI